MDSLFFFSFFFVDVTSGDLTELRILEWCNLNKLRLASVIYEMNTSFKYLSKRAQLLMAIMLRRAIWNWIETFPSEFGSLWALTPAASSIPTPSSTPSPPHTPKHLHRQQSNPKISSDQLASPDQLFFTLLSLNDSLSRRRVLFWPLQIMLLMLCPEIMSSMWKQNNVKSSFTNLLSGSLSSSSSSSHSSATTSSVLKAQTWFDSVRKNLKSKLGEVSTLCLVDVCRASTFVGKVEGGMLRLMAYNMEMELKIKLFSSILSDSPSLLSSSSSISSSSNSITNNSIIINTINNSSSSSNSKDGDDASIHYDTQILIDCLTSFFKLSTWNTLRHLVPKFLDPQVPSIFKIVLVKSCLEMVSEVSPLPWNPTIDGSLAVHLRVLFLDYLATRSKHGANGVGDVYDFRGKKVNTATTVAAHERKLRKVFIEESNDRRSILIGVLKIWCKCPLMAIIKDTTVIGYEELTILFHGITSCLSDGSSQRIRSSAAECLRVLFRLDIVKAWDSSNPDWRALRRQQLQQLQQLHEQPKQDHTLQLHPLLCWTDSSMFIFWKISSQVVESICKHLLNIRQDNSNHQSVEKSNTITSLSSSNSSSASISCKSNNSSSLPSSDDQLSRTILLALLELLKDLLRLRNIFLKIRPDMAFVGSGLPERVAATEVLETALLVLLCFPHSEVISLTVECVGLLVDEIDITEESTSRLNAASNSKNKSYSTSKKNHSNVSNVSLESKPLSPAHSTAPMSFHISSLTADAEDTQSDAYTVKDTIIQQQQRPPSFHTGRLSPEISSDSMVSFPLDDEIRIVLSVVENMGVYRELKGLFDGIPIVVSQKVLQKRIRKVI